MNVLSVFDGISAGRLALQRAGIEINKYYRSEIDKYASYVTMHHFPNDIQLGDVTKWREWNIDWSSIDLFIGGSPCQGFSFAGKQAGTKAILSGEETLVTDRETYIDLKNKDAEFLSQSHLFWEYVLILDHIKKHNPNVKFLLENVKMKKELLQMISDALGVKDVVINSSLVSAQNRHRHYWANWEITQPEDKGILLRDILEGETLPEFNLSDEAVSYMGRLRNGKPRWEYHKNPTEGKAACLTANMYKGVPYGVLQIQGGAIRGQYIVDGKRQDHKMKTAGLTKQRLELRDDGKTNCLTTVQKDNVVVFKEPLYPESTKENQKNEAAFIEQSGMNETVMKNGKTYCLTANCGGAWAKHSATKKVRTMAAVGFTQDTDAMTNHNQIKYRKLTPQNVLDYKLFLMGGVSQLLVKRKHIKLMVTVGRLI